LNQIHSGLLYSIGATKIGGSSASATFGIGEPGESGQDLRPFEITNQNGYGTLSVTCTNEWLRHLAACVEFRDVANNVITPDNWHEQLPDGLIRTFEPDATIKYVELIQPVETVFGIPIPADSTTIHFPVPNDAHTVKLYWGGLGRGEYKAAVCPIGVTMTVIMEMALPMILLVAGTAVLASSPVVGLWKDRATRMAIYKIGAGLVAGGSVAVIASSQDPSHAAKTVAVDVGPMLLTPAFALGRWCLERIAEGAAERAIPFFDIVIIMIDIAATAAQLSQTICETLEAPFYFVTELTRSIDLTIILTPDHRYHRFPDQSHTYIVSVVYDKSVTLPRQNFTLPGRPPWSDDITVTFNGVPAGGKLKVYVFFYAENGWQAGQGESPWMEAKGTDGSTLVIDGLEVTTNIVPLTKHSVYLHESKIAFDPAQGGHYWQAADAPTATPASPPPDAQHAIQKWTRITTAQSPAQIAYVWEATGLSLPPDFADRPRTDTPLFAVQNLSTLQHPDQEYALAAVGFTQQPDVLYDVVSHDDGSGMNFFLDPTAGQFDAQMNPAGGHHLRRVSLTFTKWPAPGAPPIFAPSTNESWGRFPMPLDRCILLPERYAVGINYTYHKLYILRLREQPGPDATAPLAHLASGEGFREGLIRGPVSIAAGIDGRLLVLEEINQRIQAFDVHGNPVPYFKDSHGGGKTSMLQLPITSRRTTYLDLAVEPKGYLYVLRCTGDVTVASNYNVDLYEPDGTPLVTTPNVTAAKFVVDILRNMFTLNYETIIGTNGRTEPSISLWIPPAPPV
jgi:hypothetical protein